MKQTCNLDIRPSLTAAHDLAFVDLDIFPQTAAPLSQSMAAPPGRKVGLPLHDAAMSLGLDGDPWTLALASSLVPVDALG